MKKKREEELSKLVIAILLVVAIVLSLVGTGLVLNNLEKGESGRGKENLKATNPTEGRVGFTIVNSDKLDIRLDDKLDNRLDGAERRANEEEGKK